MTITDETAGHADGAVPDKRGRSPRRRRWLKRLLVLIAIVVVIVVGLLVLLMVSLGRIERVPGVFGGLGSRPEKTKGETFLVLGTDRRSLLQTTGSDAKDPAFLPGEQRSDTLMLVHLTADRHHVYAVSIPRDSWVDIPGHGKAKINAAYSLGGTPLAVRTVEQLTGVHIDHVGVIDWYGFRRLTDAVGGVTVTVPNTVTDSIRSRTWTEGTHHLDGADALDYVGQRYGLPGGDFDRVRRQQYFLRQLTTRMLSANVLDNPLHVKSLVDELVANVSVDDQLSRWDMVKMGWSLRSLNPSDMQFYTVPTKGVGWAGPQSIVIYDKPQADRLWAVFRSDDAALLERRFGSTSLAGTPN